MPVIGLLVERLQSNATATWEAMAYLAILICERIPDVSKIENEASYRAFAFQLADASAFLDFVLGAINFDGLVFRVDQPT